VSRSHRHPENGTVRPSSRQDDRTVTPETNSLARQLSAASSVRMRGGSRRRDPVTCRVSLLAPAGRRTHWHYLACCPLCGAPHLGRSPELTGVTGSRQLPCGHWVTVAVARTYQRREGA
jgi:hypothetical protein